MQVKSIAEESILQYFRPSLRYQLSIRSLFCLFLSGRLREVLLYTIDLTIHITIIPVDQKNEQICFPNPAIHLNNDLESF